MFTAGEVVYHRTRHEVGTYTGPGAHDTSWVYFESDGEEVEVTTEYLETIHLPSGDYDQDFDDNDFGAN